MLTRMCDVPQGVNNRLKSVRVCAKGIENYCQWHPDLGRLAMTDDGNLPVVFFVCVVLICAFDTFDHERLPFAANFSVPAKAERGYTKDVDVQLQFFARSANEARGRTSNILHGCVALGRELRPRTRNDRDFARDNETCVDARLIKDAVKVKRTGLAESNIGEVLRLLQMVVARAVSVLVFVVVILVVLVRVLFCGCTNELEVVGTTLFDRSDILSRQVIMFNLARAPRLFRGCERG